ncbi:MAG: hypothetical protein J6Q78_03210 [Clostridia bacterium]|nr:hypothetical protein [Clostridia bacterium]
MSENKRLYLGLDIGTTSLKAAVFNEEGTRLGLRAFDYTLDTDPATGYIELDAEVYIDMCKRAIDELSAECGNISAISVDTQGETLILADESGKALCPAVVWLDNRAVDEAEAIKDRFGLRRVYEVTGQPEITAGWPASKMLWFKNNKPEIFNNTKMVFMLEDWVLYRLTGNFVTEPTIQSSTIYYDVSNHVWWKEMLDFIGMDEKLLPSLKKSGEIVGEYNGIKVVSGALDQIAGMIGVGVTDNSGISEMTGTIMAICAMKDEIPEYQENSIIPCHVHAIEGKYCQILWSSTAGMALKWFREQFASDLDFAEIDDLAKEIPAGCDGLSMLPYFCGSTMPKYNPDAKAVFAGVTLAHTKAHFARSIMEAIAYILRQDIEYIGGDDIKQIRITGGGAKSPLWAQIKADVTGKELTTVCEGETACLGSAIIAAVGIGDFESIDAASKRLVKLKKSYSPKDDDYSEAYERFVELDKKMN